MACNYPISAYRIADRLNRSVGIIFGPTKGMNVIEEFKVPCNKCDGCRLERSRQWAIRCLHEASLYTENCIITLTYNEKNLPDRSELQYEQFQRFMKRLRKKFTGRKIRFFMCGEYGDKNDRPHFHSALFNIDFDDKQFLKKTKADTNLYTSKTLDELWHKKGFATVGDMDFASASYIARYIMKKGRSGKLDYEEIDKETGEVWYREPEYTHMSLKPGIGKGWYEKWKNDVYPHDICVIQGKEMKPPQYYSKQLKVEDPELYEELKWIRSKRAKEKSADNTPERLEVKEAVLKAKQKFFYSRDIK